MYVQLQPLLTIQTMLTLPGRWRVAAWGTQLCSRPHLWQRRRGDEERRHCARRPGADQIGQVQWRYSRKQVMQVETTNVLNIPKSGNSESFLDSDGDSATDASAGVKAGTS